MSQVSSGAGEPVEGSRPTRPGQQAGERAQGPAALFRAIKAGDTGQVRRLLDEHPDWVAESELNGETPLMMATYYHADEIVQMLLERGAPVSLFEAAAIGDVRRVRQMLDDQPELVLSFSHDGWTPLHLAAHFGHPAVVDLLIGRRADVNARSRNALANTPLHAALAGGHLNTARRLLEHGTDANAVEAGGFTPLHQAADLGDAEMVGLLLAHGARTDVRTDEQLTPQDLARAKGHTALSEQLGRQAHGPA